MIARYFIYKQVYHHHVRRAYDLHLIDFLKNWLAGGIFSTNIDEHIAMSDAEVMAAIRAASRDESLPGHDAARRIRSRDHFRALYFVAPGDKDGGIIKPGEALFDALSKQIDPRLMKHDRIPPKDASPDFPIQMHNGDIRSSLEVSNILQSIPVNELDNIYCCSQTLDEARKALAGIKQGVLGLSQQGELFNAKV